MSVNTNLKQINTGPETALSTWYAPGCVYPPPEDGFEDRLFITNKKRNFFTHTLFARIESIKNKKLFFIVLFHNYNLGICVRSSIPININSELDFERIILSCMPILLPQLQSIVIEYYAPYQELCKFTLKRLLSEMNNKNPALPCEDLGNTFPEIEKSTKGIKYLKILLDERGLFPTNEEQHQDHQIDFLNNSPEVNPFDFLFHQESAAPLVRPVYALHDGNLAALKVEADCKCTIM